MGVRDPETGQKQKKGKGETGKEEKGRQRPERKHRVGWGQREPWAKEQAQREAFSIRDRVMRPPRQMWGAEQSRGPWSREVGVLAGLSENKEAATGRNQGNAERGFEVKELER